MVYHDLSTKLYSPWGHHVPVYSPVGQTLLRVTFLNEINPIFKKSIFFIQAVSEKVLDDVSKEGIISCIKSKTLGEWECEDPKKRIIFEESNGASGT